MYEPRLRPRDGLDAQMLGDAAGPHPEQDHVAGRLFLPGLGAKQSSPRPQQDFVMRRFGPVRRIGWHDLRLGPVKGPPDPPQQAQAVGSRAAATCLVHIWCAQPCPRLGHRLIGLADQVEVPACSDPPELPCPARG